MKHLFVTAAAVAAACALGACHKTGSNAGKDVVNPADSAPVNAVQDAAAGAVGMASSATTPKTADAFVPAAAMANMYEIQAAKIAEMRAQSPDVKGLAKMMVMDHTKAGQEMDKALKASGLSLAPPAGLDDRRKGMLQNLKAAGDSDFDLAYLHQQLAAHMEALTLMNGYAKDGDDASLKAFAAQTAPVVQKHLDEVKRIGGDKLKAMGPG